MGGVCGVWWGGDEEERERIEGGDRGRGGVL